jgi:hypothetical protein
VEKHRESGDGSSAGAWKLAPADLQKALASPESLRALLFDVVVGDMGTLDEYDGFRAADVGRKGAFHAAGEMLYADGGEDKSYKGTPERKALDKAIGATLERLLADPSTTKVFHVQSGDAGYGSYDGIVGVNADTGAVHALMNSWAP